MEEPEDFWVGNYKRIYVAASNNLDLLEQATSGGFVTQLITYLLNKDMYETAFLVDTFNYEDAVQTKIYKKNMNFEKTSKSRYIPVLHSESIKYILENPNEKVVFVGTSCFLHGLLNVIKTNNLNRDNYFLIGLFCDRTLNYNIFNYFSCHRLCKEKLNKLFFRTKKAGGKFGNMRLEYYSGNYVDLDAQERIQVKDYFELEGCMYCLDKLNQFADVSVGDNYTNEQNFDNGSNSLIFRTPKSIFVWQEIQKQFNWTETKIDKIIESQHINLRKKNLAYMTLKKMDALIPPNIKKPSAKLYSKEYRRILKRLRLGEKGRFKQIVFKLRISKIRKRIFG
ncbi:MAG: Coenzyme F420 hydrogenase/dehydrogenase, beta subunit C-terminal domain [Aminipila sp.]